METAKRNGSYICRATHPEKPDYSENARRRVLHLSKKHQKGTLTLCNMKVARVFQKNNLPIAGDCRICFKN